MCSRARRRQSLVQASESFRRDDSLKNAIKEIRLENITQENFGMTGVSDAIAVHKSLKHSAILYWDGVQDAQVKQELIQWRLGRIAYHQE